MEDINHSCQIAGGARIDTRCGSPLKNSTIFSWQQFLLQGGHNHNKWPSLEWKWHNCIFYRKKKKKRASVWDNYTWQSHYKQMHCTDKTAHSLTATIKLLFPNYVYQLTSFSFSSASYLSWRFLYSNCHFSAFMASAECLVWSSWACKSESIATELSIKTASFSKHVHEPDCV